MLCCNDAYEDLRGFVFGIVSVSKLGEAINLKQFFRPCVKDIPPLSREMFTFDCLCENAVFKLRQDTFRSHIKQYYDTHACRVIIFTSAGIISIALSTPEQRQDYSLSHYRNS